MIAAVLAAAVFLGLAIPRAIRNDNLSAIENLDDEALAAQTVQAWEARS